MSEPAARKLELIGHVFERMDENIRRIWAKEEPIEEDFISEDNAKLDALDQIRTILNRTDGGVSK